MRHSFQPQVSFYFQVETHQWRRPAEDRGFRNSQREVDSCWGSYSVWVMAQGYPTYSRRFVCLLSRYIHRLNRFSFHRFFSTDSQSCLFFWRWRRRSSHQKWPENDPQTVIRRSYQPVTTVRMSMCRICHRHEENYFLFVAFTSSPSLPLVPTPAFLEENHVIVLFQNYQSQTPIKQKDQAGASLQEPRCRSRAAAVWTQTWEWAAAAQQPSCHTVHRHPVCPACMSCAATAAQGYISHMDTVWEVEPRSFLYKQLGGVFEAKKAQPSWLTSGLAPG